MRALPAAPATNAPAAAAPSSAAPGLPAGSTAQAKPTPVVPKDYFQQYGKILAPGTEPSHPLKLNMPYPDIGQIKIPSAPEIDMRVKLEQLANLSDEEIRVALYYWPPFRKMSLSDEGSMLMRIQQFRERRIRIAQDKAHALGLLTLKPEQQARFEKEYWDKRLELDRDLAKQFEPILKARQAKIAEELFREFSVPDKSTAPVVTQNVKATSTAPVLGASPDLSQDAKPALPPPATPPAPVVR